MQRSFIHMATSYQHVPFISDRTIRVLRLHPGTDAPLSCDLLEVNLDDKKCLKYEALSYA